MKSLVGNIDSGNKWYTGFTSKHPYTRTRRGKLIPDNILWGSPSLVRDQGLRYRRRASGPKAMCGKTYLAACQPPAMHSLEEAAG